MNLDLGRVIPVLGLPKTPIALLSWVKVLLMLAQPVQQRHRIEAVAKVVFRGSVILLFCRIVYPQWPMQATPGNGCELPVRCDISLGNRGYTIACILSSVGCQKCRLVVKVFLQVIIVQGVLVDISVPVLVTWDIIFIFIHASSERCQELGSSTANA